MDRSRTGWGRFRTAISNGVPVHPRRWTSLAQRAIHGPLLALAVGTVSVAQEPLNVSNALGKTRAEIASLFPGTTGILRGWNGWKAVYLAPDAESRVMSVVLEPRSPITESQAEEALQRLGVAVDSARYFASKTERGYSDMDGPVRTILFTLRADGMVSRIGIFSKLADES